MARVGKANIIVGAAIAVIAVAAIAAFVWMQMGAGAADAQLRAIVHDGDGGERVLPLNQDTEVEVTTSLGTNVVVVADGAVFVRDADCDNHDCVHQGSISAPGCQIICLPHKLWIEVVAEGGEGAGAMDVDAVAGDGDDLDAVAGGGDDLDAVAR